MNKILIITIAGIMLILAMAIVVAGAFNLNPKDFTKKVKKISTEGIFLKEKEWGVKIKKCKEDKEDIKIPDGLITENEMGVLKIEYAE